MPSTTGPSSFSSWLGELAEAEGPDGPRLARPATVAALALTQGGAAVHLHEALDDPDLHLTVVTDGHREHRVVRPDQLVADTEGDEAALVARTAPHRALDELEQHLLGHQAHLAGRTGLAALHLLVQLEVDRAGGVGGQERALPELGAGRDELVVGPSAAGHDAHHLADLRTQGQGRRRGDRIRHRRRGARGRRRAAEDGRRRDGGRGRGRRGGAGRTTFVVVAARAEGQQANDHRRPPSGNWLPHGITPSISCRNVWL